MQESKWGGGRAPSIKLSLTVSDIENINRYDPPRRKERKLRVTFLKNKLENINFCPSNPVQKVHEFLYLNASGKLPSVRSCSFSEIH
jgi:hypothetical protein